MFECGTAACTRRKIIDEKLKALQAAPGARGPNQDLKLVYPSDRSKQWRNVYGRPDTRLEEDSGRVGRESLPGIPLAIRRLAHPPEDID